MSLSLTEERPALRVRLRLAAAFLLIAAASASAQSDPPALRLLDVPYIQQSESLCGGAAAAMVMRYWGATGIYAESFAPLLPKGATGIAAEDLLRDLTGRGWEVRSFRGDRPLVGARLGAGQPVVALIEDRPGYFHFVVIVGWAGGRVIYHDPARAPFRVVAEETFEAAWGKADHWTMLALPPAGGLPAAPGSDVVVHEPDRVSACSALVAEGVRTAEGGDRRGALDTLMAAAGLCPSDPAPLREAAGVHALDENWPEAGRLARLAVTRDPSDEHAWRILATAAYVSGDAATALEAWNAAGEPVIDLVSVQGLSRTRHAVATGLLGLEVNTVLTARALATASRRLAELPAAETTRVNYRPLGGGRANVDAVVIERAKLPTSRSSLAATALRLLTDRELSAAVAGVSGGGELLTAAWRWWEARPRIELAYAAPSALGIWRAEVFGEEQSYATPEGTAVDGRRGGALALSQWTGSSTRWEIGGALDAWRDRGRTLALRGDVDQRLMRDRIALRAGGAWLTGAFDTWTARASVDWRSRVRHEHTVFVGETGIEAAGTQAPRALWPGAGTGHARGPLLRAHPLLDDGRISGEVFGRRVYFVRTEARRWMKRVMALVRVGPAVFVDVAAAEQRLVPGSAWHADAGAGLRVALPGTGVLRLDVAKGLRDGATAVSIGWTR